MGSKSASGAVKKGDVNKMADFLCKTTPFWGERLDDGSAKDFQQEFGDKDCYNCQEYGSHFS
nr:PREDICTED: uncharacterized protein LOC107397820 isoform X2 [Tribolium castaneum]|eukprot:XP_015834893.1 PREDICTED: uncharacterized protein LOC107397820 isoform X2 [Tribolium castaneum]